MLAQTEKKELKEVVLTLDHITLKREENRILENVSLLVHRGELVYLIGKVGSGKSTLIKALYADVPIKGNIATLEKYDLLRLKRKDIPYLRREVGIIFQDFQLLTDRNVSANLEFVLRATGWKEKHAIQRRIEEVLTLVGLEHKGYKMPHELSGGEQQRTVIARALLNHPALILADEPTGNLDPDTSDQIAQLLDNIRRDGTAVIMSTHNYTLIKKYPGRIIRIEDGKLEELYKINLSQAEPLQ